MVAQEMLISTAYILKHDAKVFKLAIGKIFSKI